MPGRMLAAGDARHFERGVHIAVLWALAVAQPLFDLLGRNPEFFATRGSPPGDIVAFAAGRAFAGPLVLIAVEWLAGLASEALAWALHLVCVAAAGGGDRAPGDRRSPGRCPPSPSRWRSAPWRPSPTRAWRRCGRS